MINRIIYPSNKLLPAKLNIGTTLIAVHTGFIDIREGGDSCRAIEQPAKQILREIEFNYKYEFIHSKYVSYLSEIHDGYLVDQSSRKVNLKYTIPNLYGNKFVLIGGGFEKCHLKALLELTKQIIEAYKNGNKTDSFIFIPTFAIYENYESNDSGEYFMNSKQVDKNNSFDLYHNEMLKILRNSLFSWKIELEKEINGEKFIKSKITGIPTLTIKYINTIELLKKALNVS